MIKFSEFIRIYEEVTNPPAPPAPPAPKIPNYFNRYIKLNDLKSKISGGGSGGGSGEGQCITIEDMNGVTYNLNFSGSYTHGLNNYKIKSSDDAVNKYFIPQYGLKDVDRVLRIIPKWENGMKNDRNSKLLTDYSGQTYSGNTDYQFINQFISTNRKVLKNKRISDISSSYKTHNWKIKTQNGYVSASQVKQGDTISFIRVDNKNIFTPRVKVQSIDLHAPAPTP